MSMEFIRTRKTKVALSAALGAALLTGCQPNSTSTERPPAARQHWDCTPERGTWGHVPSNFNRDAIAANLGHGITPGEVAAGSFGNVHCDRGVTGQDVLEGDAGAVVSVKGIGAHCLAVFVQSPNGPPHLDQLYQELATACPALPNLAV